MDGEITNYASSPDAFVKASRLEFVHSKREHDAKGTTDSPCLGRKTNNHEGGRRRPMSPGP